MTVELPPRSFISSGAGVFLLLHLLLHFASLHPGMAPKKEIKVESTAVAKRGRGRPPKKEVGESSNAAAKRGRGRPPKRGRGGGGCHGGGNAVEVVVALPVAMPPMRWTRVTGAPLLLVPSLR